jgi:hypothetical protein
MPVVQGVSGFPAGTRLAFERVRIVESDQAFPIRSMQRERIFDAVRPRRAHGNAAGYEPDPMPRFRIDDQDLPVQIEQGIKGWVALHQISLSQTDNNVKTPVLIPHAGGTYPPKQLTAILGGFLSFDSDWNPALGSPLHDALNTGAPDSRLDLGCVAAHGTFSRDSDGHYMLTPQGKPATAFLFELIARLQTSATVPMIDVSAYARWLA